MIPKPENPKPMGFKKGRSYIVGVGMLLMLAPIQFNN